MIDIGVLKDKSNLDNFLSGQVIIEEGESMCDNMYILLKGTAAIYKNYQEPDELKITTLKPGDFFGEMSLFLNKERTATVVAEEAVITLTINRMNAYDFFENQPQMTYSLIKTLCSRLDSTNSAYRKLYSETQPANTKIEEPSSPSLSWLFPNGHKRYRRTINMSKVDSLTEKEYKCPLCAESFTAKTATVFEADKPYNYLRPAKGRSNFYFEVITCPKCWYSAFSNIFYSINKKSGPLFEQYSVHKPEINTIFLDESGIAGVFIGYLFALKCVPVLFDRCNEITAKLWVRLSWLYCDCKDRVLEEQAAAKARDAYIAAIQKREIAMEHITQTYLTIGELSLKANDLQAAKNYFHRAGESSSDPGLRKLASERGDDVQQRLSEQINTLRAKSLSGNNKK